MNSSTPLTEAQKVARQQDIDSERALDIASVGSVLQRAREKRSLSRQDAADELNLRPDQLDFLEHNQFDRLPGDPFVRGYIRNYAKWLDMDADKMVDSYVQQSGVANEVSQSAGIAAKAPVSRVNHSGRILAAGLVVSALILGFWMYNSGDDETEETGQAAGEIAVDTFSGKPLQDEAADNPAANWENPFAGAKTSDTVTVTATAESSNSGTTADTSQPTVTVNTPAANTLANAEAVANTSATRQQAAPAPVASTTSTSPALTTNNPSSINPSSTNRPSNDTVSPASDAEPPIAQFIQADTSDGIEVAAAEQVSEVDRGPESIISGSGSDQLIFFFSEDCWLQVTEEASGKNLFSAVRYSGQSLILNGKAPFELRVGNAPAVDLTFNGQKVEVRSRYSSKSARLTIGGSE